MVSRYIISDAETRNFARQMGGVFMLLPDAKLWGNQSRMVLKGGDAIRRRRARAQRRLARRRRGGPEPPEQYTGASASLGELFARWRRSAPGSPMRETQNRVDARARRRLEGAAAARGVRRGDGRSGGPTRRLDTRSRGHVAWTPSSCIRGTRRATRPSRCGAWTPSAGCRAKQRRCHAPLTVAHASRYKGRHEAASITCTSPTATATASATPTRGADLGHNFHQAVLTKQPAIDLVASLATNPHAFEPHFSAARAAVREVGELLAWLFNGAARRLDPAALGAALGNAPGDSDAPAGAPSASRFERDGRHPPRLSRPLRGGDAGRRIAAGRLRASDDGAAAGASVEPAVAALSEAARRLVVAAREATDASRPSPAAPNTASERAAAAGGDAGGDATSSEATEAAGGSGCGDDGSGGRGGRRSLCKA